MMDGYVVGSVADFISNSNFELKPKKKKTKPTEGLNSQQSQIRDVNCSIENNLMLSVHHFKLNNQNKRFKISESEKCSQNHSSTNSVKIVTSSKSDGNKTLKNKTELSIKKRTKSFCNEKNDKKSTKPKKFKIDLPALNHIPTDSEDEIEKKGEILAGENKISNEIIRKKDYKENTIFVGNIPINYDKQKICKVFSKFGEIQNARIRCVPIADINVSKKVAAIKKEFNPKRKSFVAYVKFKSQESVCIALKANGMVVDGHHLRIDSVEENKERDNNKAVFVGGLPFDIEDDELWEFFKNCGQINSVRIIRDSQFSMGKGFGYVNFDSTASVELALQLNGQELKKRIINVKRCTKARNKSKLHSFNKEKSKEISKQLLCKKSKKFKEERKKFKKERNLLSTDFQGKKANIKQKKKKKMSKAALHQKKLIRILNPS